MARWRRILWAPLGGSTGRPPIEVASSTDWSPGRPGYEVALDTWLPKPGYSACRGPRTPRNDPLPAEGVDTCPGTCRTPRAPQTCAEPKTAVKQPPLRLYTWGQVHMCIYIYISLYIYIPLYMYIYILYISHFHTATESHGMIGILSRWFVSNLDPHCVPWSNLMFPMFKRPGIGEKSTYFAVPNPQLSLLLLNITSKLWLKASPNLLFTPKWLKIIHPPKKSPKNHPKNPPNIDLFCSIGVKPFPGPTGPPVTPPMAQAARGLQVRRWLADATIRCQAEAGHESTQQLDATVGQACSHGIHWETWWISTIYIYMCVYNYIYIYIIYVYI